jgi:hypothetical protein
MRYSAVAGGPNLADLFKFYMWNCALSEAFYLPLQMAEIAARNAIHRALIARVGQNWYQDAKFTSLLSARYLGELNNCVAEETAQHGANVSCHHVCSGLTFGFWEHLTTSRFNRLLWKWGIRHNFPNAPAAATPKDLHDLIESVRRWRNRIAHHKAIFDKGPTKKYQDTICLIRWVCDDTANWVTSISNVQQIINAKPA